MVTRRLVRQDKAREGIEEQRGFARRPVPPETRIVSAVEYAGAQERDSQRRDRFPLEQIVNGDAIFREFTDRNAGAADGEGLDDGVDAGAVAQTGIDEGLAAVDAPPQWGDDALNDGDGRVIGGERLRDFHNADVAARYKCSLRRDDA